MDLQWENSLACFINIRAGLGAYIRLHATTWKTIAATSSSRPNHEALAASEVLAHPCVTFHLCTCGLRWGAAMIPAVLISYDDMEVATGMTMRRRRSWSTTSSTLKRDYVGRLLQLFFRCSAHLVVTIYDLLLISILGWHDRSSASVAYPYSYKWCIKDADNLVKIHLCLLPASFRSWGNGSRRGQHEVATVRLGVPNPPPSIMQIYMQKYQPTMVSHIIHFA
jgi:hypothetical protein